LSVGQVCELARGQVKAQGLPRPGRCWMSRPVDAGKGPRSVVLGEASIPMPKPRWSLL